jgi:hypothetical protein
MLEQRRTDVFDERHVGHGIDVCVLRLREWRVHGSMYPGGEAMLEQRSGDLLEQWPVGLWRDVHR